MAVCNGDEGTSGLRRKTKQTGSLCREMNCAAGRFRLRRVFPTSAGLDRANRDVLKRIKETGDIFFAISDREWMLSVANVSMVGFDNGSENTRVMKPLGSTRLTPSKLCAIPTGGKGWP